MAYKIHYNPQENYRYPNMDDRKKVRLGNVLGILLVLAVVVWLSLAGIPDFMIPGDANQTKAAASTMIAQVKAGESVGGAVTAFCKEIVNDEIQ